MANHINGVKVSFRPGKLFKNELANADFVKIAADKKDLVLTE